MEQPSYGVLSGTAGKPSFYFVDDPDTGFYLKGAGVVAVVVGGVEKALINATGVVPASPAGGWAITSFTEDKTFAGNSTTAADAVKGLASLVNDLIGLGILSGSVAA